MTEYQTSFGNDAKDDNRTGKPEWRMCSLAKAGNIKQICLLIIAPKYICRDCGRVSSQRSSICNPQQITS